MTVPTVVPFSQRDPRWAADPLGTSELTLGRAGCLITAAASLLASWGGATDPRRLNVYLKQSRGYVDDCFFVFASIDALGAQFTEFIDCYRVAAPIERLVSALEAGAGCLAMVDWRPGGSVQPHWVWITALTTQHGQIMDPWQLPGRECVDLATYLASGWTPARGIFLVALYSRGATGRTLPSRVSQPALSLRPEI